MRKGARVLWKEGFDSEAEAEALAEMLNRHRELLAEFGSPHRPPGSPSGSGLGRDAFLEEVEAESAAIDRELEKYDREFASPLRGGEAGGWADSASVRGGGSDRPGGVGRRPALSTPERGPVFRPRTAPAEADRRERLPRGGGRGRREKVSRPSSGTMKKLRAERNNLQTRLESQGLALKDLRRDARRKRRELEEAAEERDRLRASLQSARSTIAALESQLRALPDREKRHSRGHAQDPSEGELSQAPNQAASARSAQARSSGFPATSHSRRARAGTGAEYEERVGSPTPAEWLAALRRRVKELSLRDSQSTERAKALSQRLKDMSQHRDKAVKEREEAMQRADEALRKAEGFRSQFKMSQERAKREGERAGLAKEGLVATEEKLKESKAALQSLQRKYHAATEKTMQSQQRLEGEQQKVKKRGEEAARAEAHARDLAAELHVYKTEKAMLASRRQKAGAAGSRGNVADGAPPPRSATSIDKAKARIAAATPSPRKERPQWGSGGGKQAPGPASPAPGAARAGSTTPGKGAPNRGKWAEASDSDSDSSDIDFDSVYRSTVNHVAHS